MEKNDNQFITITMSRNKYITKIISVLHRTGKTSA